MNLFERVKAILVTPKTEWQVIAREPGDLGMLFTSYVAILAAIPAICGLVGWVLVGAPLLTGIMITLVRYVLSFRHRLSGRADHRCAVPDLRGRQEFRQCAKTLGLFGDAVLAGGRVPADSRARHPADSRTLRRLFALARDSAADARAGGKVDGLHRRDRRLPHRHRGDRRRGGRTARHEPPVLTVGGRGRTLLQLPPLRQGNRI
jgi:hypothetical protein